MVRVRISQVGLALAITGAALATAVAGCGQGGTNNAQPQPSSTTTSQAPASSSSSEAAPATSSSTTSAPPADNGLCKAADLKLSLGTGDAAAGTSYRPLVFTNVSDHSCVIQGFPGVSYVGGDDGHQIGKPADRDGEKGPAITLAKGGQAFADIGFATVQNYDDSACQPQPARGLRVYPPQETASMYIDNPRTGCANMNLPGNQLTVKTIEEGTGGQ